MKSSPGMDKGVQCQQAAEALVCTSGGGAGGQGRRVLGGGPCRPAEPAGCGGRAVALGTRAASASRSSSRLPSGHGSSSGRFVSSQAVAALFSTAQSSQGLWDLTASVTSMTNASSPFFSLFPYPLLSSAGIVQIILALPAKRGGARVWKNL